MTRWLTKFVDAGPLLARYRDNDQYHREAVQIWRDLAPPLVTSNHVIDELASTLERRAGGRFAADVTSAIYASSAMEVVQSTREDELAALHWMRKYSDHRIGFTDCVSFAIMRRRGIHTAFTFDRHFRTAGFDTIGLK